MSSRLSQMWLPLVMTSTPAVEERSGGGHREAHPAGHVLAVGGDEVDPSLLAQTVELTLERLSSGLADERRRS